MDAKVINMIVTELKIYVADKNDWEGKGRKFECIDCSNCFFQNKQDICILSIIQNLSRGNV